MSPKKSILTKLERVAAAEVAQYVYELAAAAASLSPTAAPSTSRAAA